MFLMEEVVGPNGRGHAMIFMRNDGSFEGRIYRKEKIEQNKLDRRIEDYETCVQAETLLSAKAIVLEELGF